MSETKENNYHNREAYNGIFDLVTFMWPKCLGKNNNTNKLVSSHENRILL